MSTNLICIDKRLVKRAKQIMRSYWQKKAKALKLIRAKHDAQVVPTGESK